MLLRGLGPIRQFGYVVHDLRAAMQRWTEILGVGPFLFLAEAPIHNFRYRGQPSATKASVAFSSSGGVSIELIQPLDEHPWFQEYRQHVAYWTTELDSWIVRCKSAGIEVLHSGDTGAPDGRFVYLDIEAYPGTLVEISEVPGKKGEFYRKVAHLCETWDGSDPIRPLVTGL